MPDPHKPRQPSKPEIQGASVDKLVGRATDLVGATTRKQTFTGLGAMAPPPLPLEHRPTAPAAALQAPTQRAPTPAAGMPAQAPDEPSQEALRAALAAAERRNAELERRERVRTETASPNSWPPKVERSQSPVPSSESIRADGTVQNLRKAQTRLYLALAAFVALAAYPTVSWLQSAAEVRAQSQRADVKANAATTVADSAKATATDADKELTKLRDEFRLYRANMREVMRLQGIDMPRHTDDPDPNDLKPVTPYCPRGKVCTGPQLVLQVAP
jgi:hypothetical protein